MNDAPTIEERIAARTDLAVAGSTEISSTVGGLAFKDMSQVMEFSKLMALSRQAVPKHLRAEAGACMAVTLQALNWRMDPFAVANKSYMVNDRIAYEAQLIHAVIEQRAPIKGRIKGRLEGKDQTRQWILSATLTDGDTLEYEGPEIGKITTKNSPLWKADPDQQLWYYSVRAMCRRHFPDVILGVYEKEEIEQAEGMRDVTPREPGGFAAKAKAARGETSQPVEKTDMPAVEDAQVMPHWTEGVAWDGAFPGSEAWDEGVEAFNAGTPSTDCPYDADQDKAAEWLGGWHGAERNKA